MSTYRPKFKLRTKIIAWSFIPTAIILLLVATTIYLAYQDETERVVISRDRELTRLTASEVSASFEDFYDRLTALARQPAVYKGSLAEQRKALENSRNRLVFFDGGVYLLNNLGTLIAAQPGDPSLVGQDWSGRSFFQPMVRSPGLYISNIENEGPHGENVITIAVPILGENDEFIGVAAGMFRLESTAASSLYGNLLKLRIGHGGQAYVVDGHQRVLFSTDTSQIGTMFSNHPIAQEALKGEVDARRAESLDGRNIVAGYAPIPRTRWTLVVEQDWGELVRQGQGYRRFLWLLLALGVIIPTITTMVGVRRITGPIADFTTAAGLIAGGDLSQRINVNSRDELEALADQFNAMAAHLQESYENLEQRVAQRTQELTALNSIAAVVSRSLNLDDILPDALEETIKVMGMDAGAVFRLDEENRELIMAAGTGLSQELIALSRRLPIDRSVVQEVIAIHHPISRAIHDYPPGIVRSALERDGWKAIVSIPLLAQDKTLGAINVLSSSHAELSPEELAVPAAIGQQIGVAMDNARLYNQTVEYAHQMEVARQAAEEARALAEAANAAKSDFLANVSHELRTPLVSILGFTRIVQKRLEERIFPLLPESGEKTERVTHQIEENLEIILKEGQRLTTMINDLLDLEKIESGKMEWHFQPVSSDNIVQQAATATASLFDGKPILLQLEIPNGLPPVNGDPDKLIQVMINLISNAVKFTSHGTITIRAQQSMHQVVFSVIDEGIGIAPGDQELVFEKFRQVGDKLTGKPQGTGLGLAISKQIIDHHQGQIWLESEPGKGSNFSFAVPIYSNPSDQAKATGVILTDNSEA